MKKLLILLLFVTAGYSIAQDYPLVTIQDIQFVPDSLRTTDPPSPLTGDTIRVRGVVMAAPIIHPDTNRRDIISAGARWVTYIQDPDNNLWGGLNVLQEDTTEQVGQLTFFDLVDTAQVVEFTGRVVEFNTTTEIILITAPTPIPVQVIEEKPARPAPIELELSDLFTPGGQYNFDAEKYEGMYVIFRNIITSDRNSNGNFKINDGNGNFAFIYNQSRYFKTGPAGIIPGYQPPLDGSYITYLRGIVTTRTDGYYIVPVYPGDVGPVLVAPPLISTIRRDKVEVAPNEPVKITASISDLDGYVSDAIIHYSVNGGSRQQASMSKTAADTTVFEGTIPGVSDSALVDFYITSKDNQGNQAIFPSDTVKSNFFYLVLNRPLTIQDVQYSPFGSGNGGYISYRVTLSGVVTADTAGNSNRTGNATNRIIMQNGEGPWSGIWLSALNTPINVYNVKRGDNVTVSGIIYEDFNVTRMDSITSITVNSSGNPLPAIKVLNTGDINLKAGGVVEAEQWESVLLQFNNVSVTDINADGNPGTVNNFGEIMVSDGSGNMRVELQDGNHSFHNGWDAALAGNPNFIEITDTSKFKKLAGYMYYSFSNYKLIPRDNNDFELDVVGIKNLENLPVKYALNQNYPNPFNPSTVISYSIPKEGLVTLKIYNVLGQEVSTLVNKMQTAGSYKVNFDASRLSTGIYFYSIKAGNFSQVKKMILVK